MSSAFIHAIAEREAPAWIVTQQHNAFPSYRRAQAQTLVTGNRIFLYTTGGCFRNPTRDKGRIIGRAVVVRRAHPLDESVRFGEPSFGIGVGLRIERLVASHEGIELAPLVSALTRTFPLGRCWSGRMRHALAPSAPGDADLIQRRRLDLIAVPHGDAHNQYAA